MEYKSYISILFVLILLVTSGCNWGNKSQISDTAFLNATGNIKNIIINKDIWDNEYSDIFCPDNTIIAFDTKGMITGINNYNVYYYREDSLSIIPTDKQGAAPAFYCKKEYCQDNSTIIKGFYLTYTDDVPTDFSTQAQIDDMDRLISVTDNGVINEIIGVGNGNSNISIRYIYKDKGNAPSIAEYEISNSKSTELIKLSYTYTDIDNYGNWTERKITDLESNTFIGYEYREIDYYN